MAESLENIVKHKFIKTNGINLHYVEAGSGSTTVLLLHGFPDIWYGFRHQIPALVAAGFHVLIPDLRGFGQTDAPDSVDEYTTLQVVGDLIGLLDTLQVKQALVVGHDWGAYHAWHTVLCRPDRVKALMLLGMTYVPEGVTPSAKEMRDAIGEDFYLWVFQEPGVAEAIFKTAKNEDIMSAFLLRWNESDTLAVPSFIVDEPLPQWLKKEDLKAYAEAFSKSGWTGSLNHYRAHEKHSGLRTPWRNAALPAHVPVLTLIGKEDISTKMVNIDTPTFRELYKQLIPNSKGIHFLEGAHFIHQENHKEVNKYIIEFLQEFKLQ